jgi:hypothetical protein
MSDANAAGPVEDTLELMTGASLENCRLGARELLLVRFAALVAAGAPAASYALNIGAAMAADVQVTLDDAQDVLVAVAPIVGTARVVEATANIARGLGLVIGTIAEAAIDAEDEEQG